MNIVYKLVLYCKKIISKYLVYFDYYDEIFIKDYYVNMRFFCCM